MEKQNQIIEQVFKDAFDEFTPDVSPKVWSGISQQLAQPVAPITQAANPVVKATVAKFGSLNTWIVGGIAAVVVTAGVVFYQKNDIATTKEIPTSEVKTVVQSKNEPAMEFEQLVINEQQVITENKANQSEMKVSAHKAADINEDQVVEEKKAIDTSNNNHTSDQHNSLQSKGEAQRDVNVGSLIEQSTTTTKATPNQGSIIENGTIKKTEPLILVNLTVGFAPLQVTCMLNQEGLSADWDFGDGVTQSRVTNATHKYSKPGTYNLQCAAGDASLTKTIEVIGQINTIFSPNGDGINDYFFIDATNLRMLLVVIFDRNGKKITELSNNDEKWDGRLGNGEMALSGTYFFDLTASTENGENIKQRGTISLFK